MHFHQSQKMWSANIASLAVAPVFFLLAGCGQSRELVEVHGVVTVDGGQLPGPGEIYFAPLNEGGTGIRPAFAKIEEDGSFSVNAFPDAVGMKPGRYSVKMQIWKVLPVGIAKAGVDAIPPGYKFEELVVDMETNPLVVNYDVKTK